MPRTPGGVILWPLSQPKDKPIPNADRLERNDPKKWAARGGSQVGNITRQLLRQMQRRSGA